MITLITSNWKLALEIVIVVAVLVGFAVVDPFKMFDSEPKLADTPLSVKSIREIGELITAEYYGEVVASLKEAEVEEYQPLELSMEATDLTDSLVIFFERLQGKKSLLVFRPNPRNQLYKTNIPQTPFYDPYMRVLAKAYIDQLPKLKKSQAKAKAKAVGDEAKLARIAELLDVNLKAIEQELIPVLQKAPEGIFDKLNSFAEYYPKWRLDELNSKRRTRVADVVFIGRGWVKAGFKFDEFNASNFRYDANSKTIFIKDLDPVILNIDINPWFIPERQVPGFELIRATGKARNNKAVNKTKAFCKEKLRRQAMEREILQIAKKNAAESLKQLFGLLLDTEIADVVFTSEYYSHYLTEVMADSLINQHEAMFLDSIIRSREADWMNAPANLKDEQYTALRGFVRKLSQVQVRWPQPKVINGSAYTFNKYTATIIRTAQDQLVDSMEWANLKALYASDYRITNHQVDTVWNGTIPTMDMVRAQQRKAFVNSMDLLSTEVDSVYEQPTPNVNAFLSKPGS